MESCPTEESSETGEGRAGVEKPPFPDLFEIRRESVGGGEPGDDDGVGNEEAGEKHWQRGRCAKKSGGDQHQRALDVQLKREAGGEAGEQGTAAKRQKTAAR